jgi:hypothetical protein
MSDLLSCTTKLVEPRVLYVCCSASRELRGLMEWSIQRIPSSCLVATCFIRVLSVWVIQRMTCSIQDEHVMGCDVTTFFHTCAFCMSNMRGKGTLHSNGGCPRLGAVHAAAWRMDTVSIVDGNVCGMLPWRVGTGGSFSAGTLTTFRKSISANRVAPTRYYKESRL